MRTLVSRLVRPLAVAVLLATNIMSIAPVRASDAGALPLEAALSDLAARSGWQIVYRTEITKGMLARPVPSGLGPEEELRVLLQGTGLEVEKINEHTMTIRRAPLAMSSGDANTTTSNDDAISAAPALRLAQTIPAPQSADPAEDKGSVQEIIVTARKRAERIQDVPASIGVVTAADIDRRGLVGAADYLRGIPGANQVEGAGSQSIVIRGIEANTGNQGFRGGETTGTYFGETPTTGMAGANGSNIDIKVVDIERVEVLRGPQSTAFGSASMGGTVRTIPVAPKLDRYEGKFAAGYSATSGSGGENNMFQAIGNAPLIEGKLAIRAAAYSFSDSGYYRNRAGSDAAFRARVVVPHGAQAYALDEDEVGDTVVRGARISALFQPADNFHITLNYLTQEGDGNGIPVATSADYEQTILRVDQAHIRRGQSLGVTDTSIDIANVVIGYDAGWADVLGTYSHSKGRTVYERPYTSIGFEYSASAEMDTQRRQDSAEVRLATRFDGPLNFLAGVYAEDGTETQGGGIYCFGDPARCDFGAGITFRNQSVFDEDLKQTAGFGEVSWKIMPQLTATAGGRYFKSQRSSPYNRQGSGPAYNPNAPIAPPFNDTDAVFRANLSYKPIEQTMIYVGWSQGFRPGKSQTGFSSSAALCDADNNGIVDGGNLLIASTTTVDEDKVDNYELGAKFSSARFTVDAAVYRVDWTGVPVTVFQTAAPIAACRATSVILNAGQAQVEGFEVQASLMATDSLRLDLGGSSVNARIKESAGTAFPVGNRLPGSPKLNANLGVQQDFSFGNHGGFVRADAVYLGSFYGDVLNSPVTRVEAYTKLDTTVRLMLNALNVDFYIHNVTDENAFTYRGQYPNPLGGLDGPYGYQLRPRTFGVQASYSF